MKNLIFSLTCFCLLLSTSCEKAISLEVEGALVPLTVIEDPSLPSIIVNDVKLHAESFGNPNDPMVLVIHGGPGADYRSQLNFKNLVDDNYYVVFYDQRGSGLSQRLDASAYQFVQQYVDELDGVINHFRSDFDQKIILAGHSWGAMLATAYVNQYPDQIDGLILAEPGGFTWDQTYDYISRSRSISLFGENTNDVLNQDQMITSSMHNVLDYKMILSLAGDVQTGDPIAPSFWRYGYVCNAASIELAINNPEQMDFTSQLDNFQRKVLFAYSELNTAYGPEHAAIVSSEFSNVDLVEVKSCGHEIPEFGWDNYYEFISNYLEEIL